MSQPIPSEACQFQQIADAIFEKYEFSTNVTTRFQMKEASICVFSRRASSPFASVILSFGLVPPRALQGAAWAIVASGVDGPDAILEVGITDRLGQFQIQSQVDKFRVRYLLDHSPETEMDRRIIERLTQERLLPKPVSRKRSARVAKGRVVDASAREQRSGEGDVRTERNHAKAASGCLAAQWYRTPKLAGAKAGELSPLEMYSSFDEDHRSWILSVPKIEASQPGIDPFPFRAVLVKFQNADTSESVCRLVAISLNEKSGCFESEFALSDVLTDHSLDSSLNVEWRSVRDDDSDVLDQITPPELARYLTSPFVKTVDELKSRALELCSVLKSRESVQL